MNRYLEEDGDGFLATPWSLPGPHLEHHAANAPDVDLRIVPLLLAIHDLRCHPKH